MKYLLIVVLFLFSAACITAQNMDAKQIKQKIAEIRSKTNWDNKDEAKKANEEIQKLSMQLIMGGKRNNQSKDEQLQEDEDNNLKYKASLIGKITELAAKGGDAELDFAAPVREEIIEEYRDLESPTIKNPEYFQEMTMLCIDMSVKTVQRTIDQMQYYKSIKTLIITGGRFGAPVNLSDLINRASKYPLESLYIINFRNFVGSVPDKVFSFTKLNTLGLYNNQISNLSSSIGNLKNLKKLYIELNPISSVLKSIQSLNQLDSLGVAKTKISNSEIELIKKQLPNCKVLTK